ncbi:Polyketide synthase PksM [Mycena chlorophos]|uniref:Polyketide synthase PksM n=1 Tax=Mycena chlorophos TaxID=658473 RepID=A0A8H6SCV9_MYCCL|nr:Polyketide synthase PksM [Mycena chlorophos]
MSSDEPSQSNAKKRKKKTHTKERHDAYTNRAKVRSNARTEEWMEKIRAGIHVLKNIPHNKIHLHKLQKDHRRLDQLQELERTSGVPLTRQVIDKHFPDWEWIHEQGVHYGFVERWPEEPKVIMAVSVTAWGKMEPMSAAHIRELLHDVSDWSDLNYKILNNAASMGPSEAPPVHKQAKKKKKKKKKTQSPMPPSEVVVSPAPTVIPDSAAESVLPLHPSFHAELTPIEESDDEYDQEVDNGHDLEPDDEEARPRHGVDAVVENFQRLGEMNGIGWHLGQEKGKRLVSYAFAKKDQATRERVKELIPRLPALASLYRERLLSLFPAVGEGLQHFADQHSVASVGDVFDGTSPQRPWANSLTVTKRCFANYQHRDFDLIDIAFGLWWAGKQVEVNGETRWRITDEGDHEKIEGGEFIWAEYGIGVDFARCSGLVEIYWRGKLDFHGTMQSTDNDGFTRFGTSVQITKKGAAAMNGIWNEESFLASRHHTVDDFEDGSWVRTLQERVVDAEKQDKKRRTRK